MSHSHKKNSFDAITYTEAKSDLLGSTKPKSHFNKIDTSSLSFLDSTNVKSTISALSHRNAQAFQKFRDPQFSKSRRKNQELAQQRASMNPVFKTLVIMSFILGLVLIFKKAGLI